MVSKTIFIFAKSEKAHPPIIFDSEGHCAASDVDNKALTTRVADADIIIWRISPSANISSINDISLASGSSFFPKGLTHNESKTIWQGRVESSAVPGSEEEYSITYSVERVQYTEDPKLQMHQSY